MRIPFWLPLAAGALLTGCASQPDPTAIAPDHPANPAAVSAPLATPASPLAADLAAAVNQPLPKPIPPMHMHKGMPMNRMNKGSMPHH